MRREGAAREGKSLRELARLKAEEECARRRRIVFLRRELGKVRQAAKRLERELRLLGDHEATGSAGTDWNEVYERLGSTFTAREMAEMTGARAGLVASIVHRWREQGRIVSVRRGKFRKVAGRH